MATRRSTRRSQKAVSAYAGAESPTESPERSTVLRVKSSEATNKRTSKQRKTKKPKKKADKFDALKPKKPPTAFFYFLEDFRKEFQENNPDVKSMRDVGKACGEKWKTMTYEEKVQYYDMATEKRAEFDKAMADYIKRKESGDYEEYEEDSES
ncbi:hypothetical protein M9H77_11610 [Catharanthus roseus]|uniref:Uncharacterized protein n=1 Tax=Catharanthus roseus TaxID=4058 RepID=A0ACC0BF48_CATRO|nr:hypothetical protein M9H77_11610 [Catharanthus roseus]